MIQYRSFVGPLLQPSAVIALRPPNHTLCGARVCSCPAAEFILQLEVSAAGCAWRPLPGTAAAAAAVYHCRLRSSPDMLRDTAPFRHPPSVEPTSAASAAADACCRATAAACCRFSCCCCCYCSCCCCFRCCCCRCCCSYGTAPSPAPNNAAAAAAGSALLASIQHLSNRARAAAARQLSLFRPGECAPCSGSGLLTWRA